MYNKEKIEEFQLIGRRMLQAMYDARPEPDLTMEDCVEVWEKTAWHRIIQQRIVELSKPDIVLCSK